MTDDDKALTRSDHPSPTDTLPHATATETDRCNVHICSFTDFDDVKIVAGGKTFRFEFSKRFGPLMIGKRGDTVDGVPPMRSPFWDALQAWCQQGHRIENGFAVYEPLKKERYVQLIGRHTVLVPEGSEPEDVRREWFERHKLPMPETPGKVYEL